MSKESEKYLKEDTIEENRMLDNLDWVLRFMRNYERKLDDSRKIREFNRFYGILR
jgi:hypothetical protein